MARDKDKNACTTKAMIPAALTGGEGHHVGIVVSATGGRVVLAEAGDKSRSCLKTIDGQNDGAAGTRLEEYASRFVLNTLFGFARPKN